MSSESALVPVRMDAAEAEKYGHVFAKGRACHVKDLPMDAVPFRLAAVVMAGAELGFSPFTSVAGISIVEGKPRLSYQLMGALVRRNGTHDYRVLELSDQRASVEFFELDSLAANPKDRWRSLGTSTFTIEDAARADLVKKDVWKKYPRNMLFARALTQGVNFFCPEVTLGCPVYAEDEDFGGPGEREVQGRVVAVAAAVAPPPKEKKTEPVTVGQNADVSNVKTIETRPVVTIDAGTNATQATPRTETVILRPDGSSTPLTPATAAIETARVEGEKKTQERPARSRKKKTDEASSPASAGTGEDAPAKPSVPAEPPATAVAAAPPENPKVDVGHASAEEIKKDEERLATTAKAMGVTPENAPAALAPSSSTALATEKEAHPDVPHAGAAAFELALEVSKHDPAKPVEGKLAARAHVCGVNFYGSDADARKAWTAIGYVLPRKGDKISTYPTARQVDQYLATIVEEAEKKEKQEPLFEGGGPDF